MSQFLMLETLIVLIVTKAGSMNSTVKHEFVPIL